MEWRLARCICWQQDTERPVRLSGPQWKAYLLVSAHVLTRTLEIHLQPPSAAQPSPAQPPVSSSRLGLPQRETAARCSLASAARASPPPPTTLLLPPLGSVGDRRRRHSTLDAQALCRRRAHLPRRQSGQFLCALAKFEYTSTSAARFRVAETGSGRGGRLEIF